MPDTTNIQSLPLIQPSQAQKHVTHNEALKILDLIVQMTVASRTVAVPPNSPALGASHIIGAGATGVWLAHVGKVTTFTGIVWEFYPPKVGWTAYVVDEATEVVYSGAVWSSAAEGPAIFAQVGVSATPDATNRLTVASPASLFSHDGAGHQLKINKATSGDNASLLFQTGFSGRAEMGTVGQDDFAIKVSADGAAFTEAVAFDRVTGRTKVQKGLRLSPAAGDLASPVDGEVWYDSTQAKFRARQNGASVDVIGGAVAAANVNMAGGGTAQDYAGFDTRAAFVAWSVGKTPAVGAIIEAAGYSYRYISTGVAISDLAGWVPLGYAFPDHWAHNLSPGVTNMVAAMALALGYSATVYLAGGSYAVGSTLAWDNATLVGNNDRGTARTVILGLSASIPVGQAVVAPGRSSTVRAVQIAYDTLTGTETQDQRVGLDTRGLALTLQRGSVIDEVVFDNVGTAISDYGTGEFSVTYGTLEIGSHSYRGVDIRGTSRTGSVWLNLYINGGATYTPEGGFCITGQGAGGFIGQLNVEHAAYSGYPVRLEGLQGLVINSLHIEGVDCTTTSFGYLGLDSASVTIQSLNVLNTRMSTDNTAVVRLARAAYQSTAVSPLLTTVSTTSNLKIGKLHLKGLASPSNTIYPSYPVGRTGVRNCPGFNVFKRDTAFTDQNWLVEVDDYLWGIFPAQAADKPHLEFPELSHSGVIQVNRFADRGGSLVPYENYVQNGAYDKWLASTATVTSGAQEVANKWTLRGATGSVTVDRVQDAFGSVGQYDARVTVGTAGTGQSWGQDLAFPVEWLGQNLRLSFEMKAQVAGRVLEQITATLQNNGAGSPATVFKQVLSGSNATLDATTGFKTYVLDFTAVDPASVTTLGTAAVMRLSFQFNDTAASRAPVVSLRNVVLAKVAGARFARSPYDRLALTTADVAGLGALATAGSVNLSTQATGTLLAAQEPAHTGDVTNTAGSLALTIAPGAVIPSKLAISDPSIGYLDLDMMDVDFYASSTSSAYTFAGTTLTNFGRQIMSLPALGTLQVVETDWFVVEATTNYRAVVCAFLATGSGGSGTATISVEFGTMDAAGVITPATKTLVHTRTDSTSIVFTPLDMVATSTERRARFVMERVAGGTAAASFGGLRLRRQVSTTLIVDANVTNAKLAVMAANTVKANATAGSAVPTDLALAASQLLGRGASGNIAPITLGARLAMAADALNATPAGSTTQVQYNNGSIFAGATEVEIENNQLRLEATTSLTVPTAGGAKLIGRADAGRTVPAFLTAEGIARELQVFLGRSSPTIWRGHVGQAGVLVFGSAAPTAIGTITAAFIATTNKYTYTNMVEYLVTVAATNAIAGFRGFLALATVGGPSAGLGGFTFVGRWGPATGVATATTRALFGLALVLTAPTDVEPSTSVSCIIMGWDAADTNIQIMHNDSAGTCTKIDLGAAFPVPTVNREHLYELAMYSPKGITQTVAWMVTDLISGATASGTIATDMPAATAILSPRGWMSAGGTSSVIGLALNSMMLDPLL